MTFKTRLAAVVTVALTMVPSAAMAGSDDYGIINKTGADITHLYVSAHEEDNWGDDILGRDVLENGEECEIEFDKDDDRCAWDLKITEESGKSWVVMNVDLCKYTKISFMKQGGKVVWSGR